MSVATENGTASAAANLPSIDRLNRRLHEAFEELWSGFVDPREAYFDDADGTAWASLGGGCATGERAGLGFGNEQEHALIRNECRALALANEFAINGHENRISYVVGSGHAYRAVVRKHVDAPPHTAVEVQAVLDEFFRVNRWHMRQQETVLRMDRDGEVFLRYFLAPDGVTQVRFVEPGQVTSPDGAGGNPAASYGVVTDPHDVETVLAYYIDGVPVDAVDVQHRKANVDVNVKRGLPLFYPVRKNLRRAEKLLRNMSTVAEIQSAIALIRKHHNVSRPTVQQFVASQGEHGAGGAPGGPLHSVRRFAPGTILDAHGNVDYDFPAAALDASSYVAVLQAELRAIAARLVMPEFMLTSDASNGSYASTLVAEGPAMRMFKRLQSRQIADDREVLRRVVENAVVAGRLDRAVLQVVELQIEPPSVAVRNAQQEAEINAVEFSHGILSPQTWSLRSGLDFDQEQANIREAHHRQAT